MPGIWRWDRAIMERRIPNGAGFQGPRLGLILYVWLEEAQKDPRVTGSGRLSGVGAKLAACLLEFIENVSSVRLVIPWCTPWKARKDEMGIINGEERVEVVTRGRCRTSPYYTAVQTVRGCSVLSRPLLALLKAPPSNYPFIPAQTFLKTCCRSCRDSISTGN